MHTAIPMRSTRKQEAALCADRNFILQQGFEAPDAADYTRVAQALLFQPRVIGLIVVAGAISRSPAVFAVLAAILWWSALVPRLNPFDFAYNRTLGRRSGAPTLGPAPMPRRFAQSMAATFATASAATMAFGFWNGAWALQAVLFAGVAEQLLGRFCVGAFIYHLVRGRAKFAFETLPWRHRAEHGAVPCVSYADPHRDLHSGGPRLRPDLRSLDFTLQDEHRDCVSHQPPFWS